MSEREEQLAAQDVEARDEARMAEHGPAHVETTTGKTPPAAEADDEEEFTEHDLADLLACCCHNEREKAERVKAEFARLWASRERFIVMYGMERLQQMLHEPAPAAEAKGEPSREEMTAEEAKTAVHAMYMAESSESIVSAWKRLLAHDAALRTRAREAEERAEGERQRADVAQGNSDLYRTRVVAILRERDEAREALAWQKNLTETGTECMRQLKSERDEARGQRDAWELRFRNLVARWDRDGGHRQSEDASPDTTLARVDVEIATHHGDLAPAASRMDALAALDRREGPAADAICRHYEAGGCATPAPAAEAKGEMSDELRRDEEPIVLSQLRDPLGCDTFDAKGTLVRHLAALRASRDALRTRARGAEERAERLASEHATLTKSAAFWGRAAAHATTRANTIEEKCDEERARADVAIEALNDADRMIGIERENAKKRQAKMEAALDEEATARGKAVADLAAIKEAMEGLDLEETEAVWAKVEAACQKAWDKPQSYNDSPAELIAKIIDERDEAREQLRATTERLQDAEKRCNHGGEHPRCQCDDEMIRRLVASGDTLAIELHKAHKRVEAAQAEAQAAREKAARLYARAEEWKEASKLGVEAGRLLKLERDTARMALTEGLATERAARVAAEAEVRHLKALNADYVKTHRVVVEGLNARLAAAEAEVKRLNNVVDEHAAGAARAGLERDRAVNNAALDARRMMEGHLTEVHALRERCRRLEADKASMLERWAIAKGEVPK